MSIPREVRTKVYTMRIVALAVTLLGAAGVFLTPSDSALSYLGLAGGGVGVWLVLRCNAVILKAQGPEALSNWSLNEESTRVGRSMWTLTAVSLAAFVVFLCVALYGNGGAWSVYACLIAGLWFVGNMSFIGVKVLGASVLKF